MDLWFRGLGTEGLGARRIQEFEVCWSEFVIPLEDFHQVFPRCIRSHRKTIEIFAVNVGRDSEWDTAQFLAVDGPERQGSFLGITQSLYGDSMEVTEGVKEELHREVVLGPCRGHLCRIDPSS